jgi:hypothetical protein
MSEQLRSHVHVEFRSWPRTLSVGRDDKKDLWQVRVGVAERRDKHNSCPGRFRRACDPLCVWVKRNGLTVYIGFDYSEVSM